MPERPCRAALLSPGFALSLGPRSRQSSKHISMSIKAAGAERDTRKRQRDRQREREREREKERERDRDRDRHQTVRKHLQS